MASDSASVRAAILDYMQACFKHKVAVASGGTATEPTPCSSFTAELAAECRDIALSLADALNNIHRVSWDAPRYCDSLNRQGAPLSGTEDDLLRRYPPLNPAEEIIEDSHGTFPLIDEATAITDRHGHVLVISLPSVLTQARQDTILAATRHIQRHVKIEKPARGRANSSRKDNWQHGPSYFTTGDSWTSGQALLAYANSQIGHEHTKEPLLPSATTRTSDGIQWMSAMEETGAILDGILSIVHPKLFLVASEVLAKCRADPGDFATTLRLWPTCFNVLHVIVNRESPFHRDTSARAGWLDMLISLGTYGGSGAIMALRNLGVSVAYKTGSIVLITSRVVMHRVPPVPADRICYAWFMKDVVHHRMGVPDPGWTTIQDILGST